MKEGKGKLVKQNETIRFHAQHYQEFVDLTLPAWISVLIIAVTLFGVAVGRYPWLRMNRASIALVGATLLIIIGAISLDQAFKALDLNTLTLLFGMMVVNVSLRTAGFFQLVACQVTRLANSPRQLLAIIILVSGVLSAVFLNDTIVLMFTPLVLEIATSLKRSPIPYLIALVTSANIGSAATITGNPQNMLIGISSQIPFVSFTAHLAPVSIMGMITAWVVIVLIYRSDFRSERLPEIVPISVHIYKPLLYKGMLATGVMLIAFIAGSPIPLAALAAATVLLVTRRVKPARVFQNIDLSLLVFFSGLFIVTGAIETTGITADLFTFAKPLAERGITSLAVISVVLSNLISNVPAVLLFRPLISGFPNPQQSWLTLAMATTLAGNLTLLGSVANLIVAETARGRGVQLTFMEYLKAGVPITLISLILGIAWLQFS